MLNLKTSNFVFQLFKSINKQKCDLSLLCNCSNTKLNVIFTILSPNCWILTPKLTPSWLITIVLNQWLLFLLKSDIVYQPIIENLIINGDYKYSLIFINPFGQWSWYMLGLMHNVICLERLINVYMHSTILIILIPILSKRIKSQVV